MIQKGKATGMAGFGLTQGGGENDAVAKQIVMDLEKVQCLAQVVQTRKALRIGPDVDGLQDSLYSVGDLLGRLARWVERQIGHVPRADDDARGGFSVSAY